MINLQPVMITIPLLKKTAALLLLLCCMAQAFSGAAMLGGYYINNTAYLRNCENKARPQLHCNGRCQLLKKMKQEEKKDAQSPEQRVSGKEQVLSSKSFFAKAPTIHVYPGFVFADQETPLMSGCPSTVFHPPGV